MVIVIFAWRVTLNYAYSHFNHLNNIGRLYYNFCYFVLNLGTPSTSVPKKQWSDCTFVY